MDKETPRSLGEKFFHHSTQQRQQQWHANGWVSFFTPFPHHPYAELLRLQTSPHVTQLAYIQPNCAWTTL
ncbi:hypothetical protein T02_11570 [Trichinella nativa]|uniref:Uncharacterized protein n=1 Tax=Trichinella nativa TaxID=6335 RepID=A0A0V1KQ01_9BILA|nr:hypothetical protein T02_11570 [Trichinella nativa]